MTERATKRCSECRKTFEPDVRVGRRQQVCSRSCGLKRRRRQARQRRERDLLRYREDERLRKRRSRERLAEGGHAPRERSKPLKSRHKVEQSVDTVAARLLEMSRAQLELQATKMAEEIGRILAEAYGAKGRCHAPSDLSNHL
jgi:hypothetical protein